MGTRDMTFTDAQRLEARAGDIEVALVMDEDAFRAFYDRTARPLWLYLWRVTGDRHAADDLLQETYYRVLRADTLHVSDAHRRNALFHIATNLVRDSHRRRVVRQIHEAPGAPPVDPADPRSAAAGTEQRVDLRRAMARLNTRERALVWLAYGQGSSHREIAETLGLKTGSVKPLLFRARRKLAAFLVPFQPAPPRGNAP